MPSLEMHMGTEPGPALHDIGMEHGAVGLRKPPADEPVDAPEEDGRHQLVVGMGQGLPADHPLRQLEDRLRVALFDLPDIGRVGQPPLLPQGDVGGVLHIEINDTFHKDAGPSGVRRVLTGDALHENSILPVELLEGEKVELTATAGLGHLARSHAGSLGDHLRRGAVISERCEEAERRIRDPPFLRRFSSRIIHDAPKSNTGK
jgi:hypothetical protein